MLGSIRHFLSGLGRRIAGHRWAFAAILVALLAAAGVAAYLAVSGGDDNSGETAAAPAPRVVVKEVAVPDETDDLGFPTFATKNTTRVAGADPISDAAAVALAVYPSTGGVPGPDAVSLVDAADWPGAVAAAALVADPVGAPILLSDAGEVPPLTGSAIRQLDPGVRRRPPAGRPS